MPQVVVVSVNRTFDSTMTLRELESWAERAWATSVAAVADADRVVAVYGGEPVAAWRLRGAFETAETYRLSNGEERPRIALALGEPLPVIRAYPDVPGLQSGIRVVDVDCPPLAAERPRVADDEQD